MTTRRSFRNVGKQPVYVQEEEEDDFIGTDVFDDHDDSTDCEPEESDHETDSEEEEDSDDEIAVSSIAVAASTPEPAAASVPGPAAPEPTHFVGKDGITQWNKKPPRTFHKKDSFNNFTPGRQLRPNVETELEAFELFFDPYVFDRIVEFTNLKIQSVASKLSYKQSSVRPTDQLEIRTLFGLLFGIGSLKGSRTGISHLWKPEDGFGWDMCRCSMSYHRFSFLMRYSILS